MASLSPLPEVPDWKKQEAEGEGAPVEESKDSSETEEESSDIEEEEKSRNWTDQVEKEAARMLARYLAGRPCGTAGCKNPLEGGIQCPDCEILGTAYLREWLKLANY